MGDLDAILSGEEIMTAPAYHTYSNGSQSLRQEHHGQAFDNPAYRPPPSHTVSSGRALDGTFHVGNHLVFDTGKYAQKTVEAPRGYSANKYATTKHPPAGVSPRLLDHADRLKQSQTVGRRTIPLFFRTSQRGPSRYPPQNGLPAGMGIGFRRLAHDGKESCISFFDIETDKVGSYQYRPGEEVSGAIHVIVRQSLEIRYVELVVVGEGVITMRKSRDGMPKTVKETYLHKQKCVIGSSDATWSSVLTPGSYTSKFRVKLPHGIPSTVHHEDERNAFTFDVTYTLKARICDGAGGTRSSSRSYTANQNGYVKVLMTKKVQFNVQRSFDISSVPGGRSPVSHTEQVHLSCTHTQAAIIAVSLDRAVFLAGDDIRLQMAASLPASQRVRDITCSLQEHITLNPKHEPLTFTLSRMIRKDPTEGVGPPPANQTNNPQESNFEITVPTQTDLMSPFSLGNSQLQLSYSMAIVLRFAPAGGKLSFKLPITLGPCAEPIYAEKTSTRKAVPVFNRPIRFPCFTAPAPPPGATPPRPLSTQSSNSAAVSTKYSNTCWARCLLCCLGDSED